MTLADVGRARRKEGDGRARPRPKDRLPQPRAVVREVRELRLRLSILALAYTAEHEALIALGSSDVHVTSTPGSQTEATLLDQEHERARDRCREAVAFLRKAAANIEGALTSFGPEAVQPTDTSPDSVVSQSTFERSVNRARHRQREEELRSP